MAQKRGRDFAPNRSVPPREVDNRNHFVPWIAKAITRNMITHGARLFPVCGCRQNHDRDVSVSRGMFVAINIDKIERVALPVREHPVQRDSERERQSRCEEK